MGVLNATLPGEWPPQADGEETAKHPADEIGRMGILLPPLGPCPRDRAYVDLAYQAQNGGPIGIRLSKPDRCQRSDSPPDRCPKPERQEQYHDQNKLLGQN
jgi:hypothetical protein